MIECSFKIGTTGDPGLPWAEEVLVTKSDLEAKLNTIVELKGKVEELVLHNEYQSRLREMNYQVRICAHLC